MPWKGRIAGGVVAAAGHLCCLFENLFENVTYPFICGSDNIFLFLQHGLLKRSSCLAVRNLTNYNHYANTYRIVQLADAQCGLCPPRRRLELARGQFAVHAHLLCHTR